MEKSPGMEDRGAIGETGQRLFWCGVCGKVSLGTAIYKPECNHEGKTERLRILQKAVWLAVVEHWDALALPDTQICVNCGTVHPATLRLSCPKCSHENGASP